MLKEKHLNLEIKDENQIGLDVGCQLNNEFNYFKLEEIAGAQRRKLR